MYLPALCSGYLIARFGATRITAVGALIILETLFNAAAGHSLLNHWLSLVLQGIGWNFLFISGTVPFIQ